jgi:hypothetical protein
VLPGKEKDLTVECKELNMLIYLDMGVKVLCFLKHKKMITSFFSNVISYQISPSRCTILSMFNVHFPGPKQDNSKATKVMI